MLRLSGGGRGDLILILADEAEGTRYTRVESSAGPVLVRGPGLVRHASLKSGALALTGDTGEAGGLEIWAPGTVRALTWNGAPVPAKASAIGSLASTAPLSGPAPVVLPALTGWRMAKGSPEADPKFDDSTWQAVGGNRPNATITQRPDGQPNMVMDAYGFHEGDVWYRGRFDGNAGARTVSLFYGAGVSA